MEQNRDSDSLLESNRSSITLIQLTEVVPRKRNDALVGCKCPALTSASSPMIARHQRESEAAAVNDPPASDNFSTEAPVIAQHLDRPVLDQHDSNQSGRRLRNRLIIANAIAWIVIIVLIRLIFF